MMTRVTSGLALLLATLFAAGPAFAQSDELTPVLDRLQRLERDIRTLNLQISRGGDVAPGVEASPSSSAAARTAVRLADLEDELRAVTGRVENVSFELVQMKELLERINSDIDMRLRAMDGSANAIRAAPSPPGVQKVIPGATQPGVLGTVSASDLPVQAVDGVSGEATPQTPPAPVAQTATLPSVAAQPLKKPTVLPDGSAKDRYKFSFGLLRRADYAGAELAFKEFISLHGDDPLAGNARYWLGESHYVRGQYVKAAEVFLAGYQADVNSKKAPDSLLKLGMSLLSLDKKAQACASFAKLSGDFPELSASIASKLASEKKRAGCE